MTGKNVTLYVSAKNAPVIDRAKKLLAFHEDKSVSAFVMEKLCEIVAKYDGPDYSRSAQLNTHSTSN